ncbi:hypothetical protein IRA69_07420 [Campylobacter hepaticus]|nr:hypothetical protein IRA69_07420 [Campylobacter hepaticus]
MVKAENAAPLMKANKAKKKNKAAILIKESGQITSSNGKAGIINKGTGKK